MDSLLKVVMVKKWPNYINTNGRTNINEVARLDLLISALLNAGAP